MLLLGLPSVITLACHYVHSCAKHFPWSRTTVPKLYPHKNHTSSAGPCTASGRTGVSSRTAVSIHASNSMVWVETREDITTSIVQNSKTNWSCDYQHGIVHKDSYHMCTDRYTPAAGLWGQQTIRSCQIHRLAVVSFPGYIGWIGWPCQTQRTPSSPPGNSCGQQGRR